MTEVSSSDIEQTSPARRKLVRGLGLSGTVVAVVTLLLAFPSCIRESVALFSGAKKQAEITSRKEDGIRIRGVLVPPGATLEYLKEHFGTPSSSVRFDDDEIREFFKAEREFAWRIGSDACIYAMTDTFGDVVGFMAEDRSGVEAAVWITYEDGKRREFIVGRTRAAELEGSTVGPFALTRLRLEPIEGLYYDWIFLDEDIEDWPIFFHFRAQKKKGSKEVLDIHGSGPPKVFWAGWMKSTTIAGMRKVVSEDEDL